MPRASKRAASEAVAAPVWVATASPNMARAFGQAPTMESAGRVSKTSGVNMKTPVFSGLAFGMVDRIRQTSRNIEAPAPPAIEEMTKMTGSGSASFSDARPVTR